MRTVPITHHAFVILLLLVSSLITSAQPSVISQGQQASSKPTQPSFGKIEQTSALRLAVPTSVASTTVAQQTTNATDAQLKTIRDQVQIKLDQFRVAKGFPGATIGFVVPDGRSGSVSTGVSDLATKRALVPDDLMLAGSIGKTFVAATILQLASEGKVNLDDRIDRWFKTEPWFPRLPNATTITVRMLLNHSSGIPNHADDEKFFKALAANPDHTWKPEDVLAFVLGKRPLFPAGKSFSYADTNYTLVGMIIERVTGETLFAEVTRRFLKPLRLDHTVPQEGRVIPGVVNGYSSLTNLSGPQGAMIVNGKFTVNPQAEWAGGGFASTAEDLARWAKALYEGGLIKQPYFDQMLAGIDTGEKDKYGLGVEIGEGRWGKALGHDGLFPGYVSAMQYFPQHKVAVAIQINTDREKQLQDLNGCIDEVMKIIAGELTGKKFDEPKDRKAVAIDPKIYDSYAGRYEIEPGVVLTLRREAEHLMVQVKGQAAAEIFPASETEYFSRRIDVQIKFVKNEQGHVTSLIIVQNGRNIPAKKIK
jgi:D-alanyl-D-alanine carboxypeptidase